MKISKVDMVLSADFLVRELYNQFMYVYMYASIILALTKLLNQACTKVVVLPMKYSWSSTG
jgi:hypothetical protein